MRAASRAILAAMSRLAPIVVVALSGCTLAFGALGGITASSSNHDARAKGQPETASVGTRIVIGALLGLVVDYFIIRESLDGCCPKRNVSP